MSRVLIFTPTWDNEMKPECEKSIRSQRIPGGFHWEIGADNPWPAPDHRNVLHQYQKARELFLCGTYTEFLTVEHDQALPDEYAVRRMLDTPGYVIYAPYVLRHGHYALSTWKWSGRRELGPSLSKWPSDLKKARERVVYRVSGTGFGCTLFRREALTALPFEESSSENPCPDLSFARACLRNNFACYGRFDVPVLHWSDGQWLHPYEVEYGRKRINPHPSPLPERDREEGIGG